MREAEVNGPTTCHCFAGLCATAIPIKMGAAVIGYLKTGQVFSKTPSEEQFKKLLGALGRKTLDKTSRDYLKKTYLETRFVKPLRYQSMVTLLQSFADQLSEHAESLAIIEEGSEPSAIAKARKYIHANLDQALPLGLVARQAGLSESHFCRLVQGFRRSNPHRLCQPLPHRLGETRVAQTRGAHFRNRISNRLSITFPIQPEFRPHRGTVPHPLSEGATRTRGLLMAGFRDCLPGLFVAK